jgi:hypothetical protein
VRSMLTPTTPDGHLATLPHYEPYLPNGPAVSIPKRLTHDAWLPNAGIPLDQALSNFDEALSPWKSPLEWINAETSHVQSIANSVLEMTQIDGVEFETLLRPVMIYQVSCNRITI